MCKRRLWILDSVVLVFAACSWSSWLDFSWKSRAKTWINEEYLILVDSTGSFPAGDLPRIRYLYYINPRNDPQA